MIDRADIRAFVAGHRALLEEAQANGSLARTKLDLKDAAEQRFAGMAPEERSRFAELLNEELEAFCADMRLASVTVQTQVERRRTPWTLLAVIAAVVLWLVTLLALWTVQNPNPWASLIVPLIPAAIAFFGLRSRRDRGPRQRS